MRKQLANEGTDLPAITGIQVLFIYISMLCREIYIQLLFLKINISIQYFLDPGRVLSCEI